LIQALIGNLINPLSADVECSLHLVSEIPCNSNSWPLQNKGWWHGSY